MSRILVAYGSKYGATAEIAQFIGDRIAEAGEQVDVLPVNEVTDIYLYPTIVLGSAVYAGNWRKEVVDFLEAHQGELHRHAVWLFSSGPTGVGDPLELMHGWRSPEALKPLIDTIAPRDISLFHGKIDPDQLNLGERLLVKALRARTGDYRDWNTITTWALAITRELAESRATVAL